MTRRRIDHLVVAVHDLDGAAAFYGRLGFQVGARNRHPWGTENRLIQFGRSFIELITVGDDAGAIPEHAPGRFSFGAFVRDTLRTREGLAMLVLGSDDAAADAARFARAGLGTFEPFFFERTGRRPDGRETRVAFTLAFAVDPGGAEAGFFVCQQHYPENFWNPAFQQHDNGATGIAAVGMAAADPGAHARFLAGLSESSAHPEPDGGVSLVLDGATLRVRPDPALQGGLHLRSITIAVPDVASQAARLAAERIAAGVEQGGVAIPREAAFGVTLRFVGDPAGDEDAPGGSTLAGFARAGPIA